MKNSKLKLRFMHFYKWTFFFMLLGCAGSVIAQQKKTSVAVKVKLDSISGVVIDGVTHKPLVGAQIQTLNPKYSAMTDESGVFTLKLSKDIKVLFVSAPDFRTREIPVYKNDKRKKVVIFPNSAGEGYYSNKLTVIGPKRNSTIPNSQKSIDIDNFSSISLDADLQKRLGGDVKVVTHSGTTGAGASMLIRGINSLSGSTQPLIVVDGVIFDNQSDIASIHLGNIISPLSNIDVNDIQDVSVLKDGTSLYGSKGGSGVILISTNRGRSLATKIVASAMMGSIAKPSTTPMMNGDQFRVYLTDMMRDRNATTKMLDQLFLNDNKNFIYYNKYHNNSDWTQGVYGVGNTQSYNVGVNGGDEIALYNLSVGFANGVSTLKSNDFNRLNARFNSDINLTTNFNTTFDISYLQSARMLRNDGLEEITTGPLNSPGFLSVVKSPFLNPYQYTNSGDLNDKLENYDFLSVANPYAILEYGVGKSQQTNFNLAVAPTYTFNKNLKLTSRFSYSLNSLSENSFSPMYGVQPYLMEGLNNISLNCVKTQFTKQSRLFSDTRLAWEKIFGYNSIALNAGIRYVQDTYKMDYASGRNTGSDQEKKMSGSLLFKTVGGVDEPAKSLSYYAIADYSLLDRYFVGANLTSETNSRFGVDANSGLKINGLRWAIFPSINAAWLVSSEDFMKPLSFISLLKMKVGLGMSGNDGLKSAATQSYFSGIRFAQYATGLQINNIANTELQWETITKRNIGLDINFFDDRLALSAELYNNTTDNLLVQKNGSYISGFYTYWTNDGKLENKGYELSLDAKVVSIKDFHFNIGASVSHNTNKILALGAGDFTNSVYGAEVLTAVGKSVGEFYGYQTNGVYATAAEAQADGLSYRTSTGELIPFEAGDVRFVNNDATDKVIDTKDKAAIGNSNPDFFGTFNTSLKYKGLGIQCIFNYSYGNDVYNYYRSRLESGSTFYNQTMAVNNRWMSEGQVTSIPKSVYGDPKGNNRFSDRWIEDGSYLRLKTVEVSYELPIKLNFLQGVTIWASANNLWTLTKYLGVDPEFSTNNSIMYQGIDTGILPQSKSYFAGIKINL